MTEKLDKAEALAKRIEQTPVGQFAILLGLNDGTHFKEIVEARSMIVAALRTTSRSPGDVFRILLPSDFVINNETDTPLPAAPLPATQAPEK